MPIKIIVDISHNEMIDDLPELYIGEDEADIDYVDKNESFDDFDLEDYDILFIGNIQHTKTGKRDKFSPDHLKYIKKFVGEGGGLLLTSGSGGDLDIPMKEGSIRVLYKVTGVRRYWNGTILETGSNFLVKNKNVLINEFFSHPITKKITELVLPNCTFFNLTEEDVEDLIYTSEKAEFKYHEDDDIDEVGQVPICAVSEFYNGRCVTIGSSEWLLEDNEYGLDAGDNWKFLENIIQWLSFEI